MGLSFHRIRKEKEAEESKKKQQAVAQEQEKPAKTRGSKNDSSNTSGN